MTKMTRMLGLPFGIIRHLAGFRSLITKAGSPVLSDDLAPFVDLDQPGAARLLMGVSVAESDERAMQFWQKCARRSGGPVSRLKERQPIWVALLGIKTYKPSLPRS